MHAGAGALSRSDCLTGMFKLKLSLVVLFWSLPLAFSHGDLKHYDAVHSLMHDLRSVKIVYAHFRETKILALLNKPLIITGILYYESPDHIRKQTLLPFSERLEIKGKTLVVVDNEQIRRVLSLDSYPVVAAFVQAFRATLAGDLDALKHFFDVQFAQADGEWHIQLTPKRTDMQEFIQLVSVHGKGTAVTKVTTTETDGDQSIMAIFPRSKFFSRRK